VHFHDQIFSIYLVCMAFSFNVYVNSRLLILVQASQFLIRCENGDNGSLWKEVCNEVRQDAERLFKLIGEAYGVLSDPAKVCEHGTLVLFICRLYPYF
jgi:hypothetical protein